MPTPSLGQARGMQAPKQKERWGDRMKAGERETETMASQKESEGQDGARAGHGVGVGQLRRPR